MADARGLYIVLLLLTLATSKTWDNLIDPVNVFQLVRQIVKA